MNEAARRRRQGLAKGRQDPVRYRMDPQQADIDGAASPHGLVKRIRKGVSVKPVHAIRRRTRERIVDNEALRTAGEDALQPGSAGQRNCCGGEHASVADAQEMAIASWRRVGTCTHTLSRAVIAGRHPAAAGIRGSHRRPRPRRDSSPGLRCAASRVSARQAWFALAFRHTHRRLRLNRTCGRRCRHRSASTRPSS